MPTRNQGFEPSTAVRPIYACVLTSLTLLLVPNPMLNVQLQAPWFDGYCTTALPPQGWHSFFFRAAVLQAVLASAEKNHLRLWECRILSARLNLRLELQCCSMLTSCIETRLVQCCVTSLKVRQQYERTTTPRTERICTDSLHIRKISQRHSAALNAI